MARQLLSVAGMRVIRGLVLLVAALLCLASAAPGERADQANGCWSFEEDCPDAGPNCPAGETCSDDTPVGLYFEGVSFADQVFTGGPHVTALGGTQTVRVLTDLPFDAASGGTALVIEGVAPPEVRVRGGEVGSAYLRILAPGTDSLYDRITLHTAAIETVTLKAVDPALYDFELHHDLTRGVTVFAGGSARLVVQLRAGETRLADESLTVSSSTPERFSVAALDWDRVLVDAMAPGTAVLRVVGGDAVERLALFRITDTVGDVVCMDSPFAITCDRELRALAESRRCFRAMDGDDVVEGVAWTFTGSAHLELDTGAEPWVPRSCVTVRGVALGTASLTASAAGATRTWTFEVIPSSAEGDDPEVPSYATPLPARGERAGGRR